MNGPPASGLRDCEQYGRLTSKDVSFNDKEEAEEVEEVFSAAVQCLGPEDRQLEPIVNMLPMLKRVILTSCWNFSLNAS